MWDRLIRPDGIDIEIASAGVDQLGRTGVAGTVYDHFWRKIGNWTFDKSLSLPKNEV